MYTDESLVLSDEEECLQKAGGEEVEEEEEEKMFMENENKDYEDGGVDLEKDELFFSERRRLTEHFGSSQPLEPRNREVDDDEGSHWYSQPLPGEYSLFFIPNKEDLLKSVITTLRSDVTDGSFGKRRERPEETRTEEEEEEEDWGQSET